MIDAFNQRERELEEGWQERVQRRGIARDGEETGNGRGRSMVKHDKEVQPAATAWQMHEVTGL